MSPLPPSKRGLFSVPDTVHLPVALVALRAVGPYSYGKRNGSYLHVDESGQRARLDPKDLSPVPFRPPSESKQAAQGSAPAGMLFPMPTFAAVASGPAGFRPFTALLPAL
jgi:hypothetical protein